MKMALMHLTSNFGDNRLLFTPVSQITILLIIYFKYILIDNIMACPSPYTSNRNGYHRTQFIQLELLGYLKSILMSEMKLKTLETIPDW